MRIMFSPQRRDDTLTLEKSNGDRLRINGELFNFNPLEDGDTIPAGAIPCKWIVGPVERIDGEVHVTVILPHGPNPSQAVAFPEPIAVTDDGPIEVPHDRTEHEEERQSNGVVLRTIFHPWGQEPQIEERFIPDEQEEPADVED